MATQTHKVLRGESLSVVAKNYSVDINELAKENNIAVDSLLRVKQELKIPEKKVRVTAEAKPDKAEANTNATWYKDFFVADTTPDKAIAIGKRLVPDWVDELLGKLRATEANERVHQTDKVKIKPTDKPVSFKPKIDKTKNSKKKSTIGEVRKQLQDTLKEPHEITLAGVKLTQNEKKQIMAAVAMCEMNDDGFGSINADQEFRGRMWGEKGIEEGISYPRIVHIGLSYGLIQFTQDSGTLGEVLLRMFNKNKEEFIKTFGNGDAEIANSLIVLTTQGHPDVKGKPGAHISGLSYWASIKEKPEGKELKRLSITDANGDKKSDLPVAKEIRGIYVQPLIPNKGEPALDIWKGVWKERFLAAAKVPAFQEVQLEVAVENYFNETLPLAKKLKVRTALALAFLAACKVRGAKMDILEKVARDQGVNTPFKNGADEIKCIKLIGLAYKENKKEKAKVGDYEFAMDEARRAAKLMKDELGFLAEDLYDLATYA